MRNRKINTENILIQYTIFFVVCLHGCLSFAKSDTILDGFGEGKFIQRINVPFL